MRARKRASAILRAAGSSVPGSVRVSRVWGSRVRGSRDRDRVRIRVGVGVGVGVRLGFGLSVP